MKDELSKQLNLDPYNIFIISPKVNFDNDYVINDTNMFSYQFFYPAVPHVSYKNHELLIETLAHLKRLNIELFHKVKVIFTTTPGFNKLTKYYFNLSKKLGVENNIEWAGYLDRKSMEENYYTCDIFLFASKLESYGLPLLEAAYRKKSIYALDTSFSREVLRGYDGVKYLANDPEIWAHQIIHYYNDHIPKKTLKNQSPSSEICNKRITDLIMESN
jgi:glycosyltransferase involved in cell wall biosynthesis